MITIKDLKAQFAPKTTDSIIKHFDEIYETTELSDHEWNMVYLAWLLCKGHVSVTDFSSLEFDSKQITLDEKAYEITFEGSSGGFNYELLYDYYEMEKMSKLF